MKRRCSSSKKSGTAAGAMGHEKRVRRRDQGGEVSHAELFFAIEAGWNYFWRKRGGAPVRIGMGGKC